MSEAIPPEVPTAEDAAIAALSDLREALGLANAEDRDQLASWEKMIKGHTLRKAWLRSPITREVFELLEGRIVGINARLSTEGEMAEEERRGIFREKLAYSWLLSLFADAKDDTVLAGLVNEIQTRTDEFTAYNNRTPI